MGTIGTFGTFTTARFGIYAAQMGLSVTGNNIANINTEGYTRQSVDQEALKPGGTDRYFSRFGARVGQGALITGLSQTRDKYLDIRYRTEATNTAAADRTMGLLNNVASILDEVGCGDEENGLIYANLSELESSLRNLSDYAGQDIYDSQVRSAASSLTSLFNNYAKRLEEVQDNTVTEFKDDVKKVNEILDSIRELTVAIRKSDIHGDAALEMRDDRNLLLDKLSEYMKISVTYSMEEITPGVCVEKLNVCLDNDNTDNIAKGSETDKTVLVNGIYTANIYCQPVKSDKVASDTYYKVDNNGVPVIENGQLVEVEDPKDGVKGSELKAAVYVSKYNPDLVTTDISEAAENYDGNYNMTVGPLRDVKGRIMMNKQGKPTEPVELLDNDLYGSLQSVREMLTEAGEFTDSKIVDGTCDDIHSADPRAAVKRGIPYYQQSLDLLARQLAKQFNEANNGYLTDQDGFYVNEKGERLVAPEGLGMTDGSGDGVKYLNQYNANDKKHLDGYEDSITEAKANLDEKTKALNALKDNPPAEGAESAVVDKYNEDVAAAQEDVKHAEEEVTATQAAAKEVGYEKRGGNLFSNSGDSNDDSEITAKNISVALNWLDGTTRIVCSYVRHDEGDGSLSEDRPTTDNDNVLHMVALMDKSITYDPTELNGKAVSDKLFVGDFSEMLNHMANVLADDQRSTSVMVQTYYNSATELDSSRLNISGVDLNDEAMNLMQYQKSYQAACRLMTTMDQVIDKLINGTGVVGL